MSTLLIVAGENLSGHAQYLQVAKWTDFQCCICRRWVSSFWSSCIFYK